MVTICTLAIAMVLCISMIFDLRILVCVLRQSYLSSVLWVIVLVYTLVVSVMIYINGIYSKVCWRVDCKDILIVLLTYRYIKIISIYYLLH